MKLAMEALNNAVDVKQRLIFFNKGRNVQVLYCILGRGDWPKMDHYDNTDHPLYLGPW